MAGYTACSGTLSLLLDETGPLAGRFPAFLLADAKAACTNCLAQLPAACEALPERCLAFPVGEAGILRALWDLSAQLQTGLDVDLRTFPIRQETIEICEYLDRDPYHLDGRGAALLVCRAPYQILAHFDRMDLPSAVIGTVTDGNDKIVRSAGRISYLRKD